ncbi:MAG TPA: GGDEF domain-containing protein [Candidatus Acidoferrales bacterium]|nr:GGDEF domain-containing protein [Candidatus Acidoferrales bacterium]
MAEPKPQASISGNAPRTIPLLAGAIVLASMPWLATLFETGTLVRSDREFWTSVVASAAAVGFGIWVIVLLRRERRVARQHVRDLEELTLTDPLTGLGNRRGLERDLAKAMLRSRRLDHPLALLYMDVDDLKVVNDRFGHAGGDETLRVVGNVARSCSREGTDSGYRVGGDEFVLIVLADRTGAEVLARRIQHGFMARSPFDSSLSLGVVEWDGAMSAGELISEADRRMYQNKHIGRAVEARTRD